MADLVELKKTIQEYIDKGATSAEEISKSIANLPMDQLKKLGIFEETLKKTQEFSDLTIGTIYDFIRKVNVKVGEYTDEMLKKKEEGKK